MAIIAEFEATYPGLFREGDIGWRYFWALQSEIPSLRARRTLEMMQAANFGALRQSPEGKEHAIRMFADTQKAAGLEVDPDFVKRLAEMLEEDEYIARGYADDEDELRELLLFHPKAEQYFPEETKRIRAEWMARR